ncbi:unnamed protein product [Gongylonema pulchrum]|uniref:Uncharacterized protein n=1 Tax=Gongylonema pulchrum TaxID=637853 RepID=A0A3P7RAC3_9BILA|nr:unnamed protein product [Gongylonema pulchrum]
MLQAANATLSEKASGTADIEGPSAIHVVKNAQIPPSCYQSFLKKRRDIAGFVLCPFDQRYIYNRINSLTDQNVFGNDTSALRKQVMAAANAVFGAVLEFLTGSNKTHAHLLGRYDIDEQYVAVLLDCFLLHADWHTCSFFKNITKSDNRFSHHPKDTYISAGKNSYSLIRVLVNALIVNSIGSRSAWNVPDREQCEDLNKHQKVQN